MVLSSDDFLLCVSIGCFFIIVTSGLVYTVWCSKCCRIPKADLEQNRERDFRKQSALPEGHAFYTTPWTMTTDSFAVQSVLAHPQLVQNSNYYFPPLNVENNLSSGLTDEFGNHNSDNCMTNDCSTPGTSDMLIGMGMDETDTATANFHESSGDHFAFEAGIY